MACNNCINNCCQRWCVDELECALECCGCCHIPVLMGPNQIWRAGEIIAQKDSDMRFYIFDPFATDGTQVPLGLAKYVIESDENGYPYSRYFNGLVPAAECGPLHTNMFICGVFFTQQIHGDVAAARAAGLFTRKEGNDSVGYVKLS